jgi:hypothetical protein
MDAALALFAITAPLCVWLWQGGRTERQLSAIQWEREKQATAERAEQKRWEDMALQMKQMETTIGATADALSLRIKRLEDNRESLRRAS